MTTARTVPVTTEMDGDALDAMARRVWLATFAHSAPPGDIEAYVAEAYGSAGTLRRHLISAQA